MQTSWFAEGRLDADTVDGLKRRFARYAPGFAERLFGNLERWAGAGAVALRGRISIRVRMGKASPAWRVERGGMGRRARAREEWVPGACTTARSLGSYHGES